MKVSRLNHSPSSLPILAEGVNPIAVGLLEGKEQAQNRDEGFGFW